MPTLHLETQIHAPIERVFDLARSIDAHVASAGKTGERAVGGRTTGLIGLGETVTWEARHLGINQRLTVKIASFDRPHMFQDVMIRGAFKSMRHTHRFVVCQGGTTMVDEFEFRAPFGLLGWLVERFYLTRYLHQFLIERNRMLKQTAESEEWRRFLTCPTS